MEEKLRKKYPWLYTKKGKRVVGKKREYFNIELNPVITDCGSHWSIVREQNASPLILSKNF